MIRHRCVAVVSLVLLGLCGFSAVGPWPLRADDFAEEAETGPGVIAPVPEGQDNHDSLLSEPKVPPGTPADPLSALVAADPAIAKAEAEFQDEIAKAETVYKAARRAAAEKRLLSVKRRVEYQTKQGDFDKATVARAAQVQLETSGVDLVRPRPTNWVKFGGHAYALISDTKTWHEAKQHCEEMGGHLAVINNYDEALFLASLSGDKSVWFGATDEVSEGRWHWITKSSASVPSRNFNNDHGIAHSLCWHWGDWNDGAAGERFAFICEWD